MKNKQKNTVHDLFGSDANAIKAMDRKDLSPEMQHLWDELVAVSNNTSDAIIKLDQQWRLTSLNQNAADIFGIKNSDQFGVEIWEVFPGLVSTFYKGIKKSVKNNQPEDIEGYFDTSNIWLRIRPVVCDKDIYWIIRDISLRVQIERESLKQQTLLSGVLDNVLFGVVVIDEHGIMTLSNPSLAKMTGYTQKELQGQNISILMDENNAARHDGLVKKFLRASDTNVIGSARKLSARRKDGTYFQVEISITKCRIDRKPYIIGSIYDLTEKTEQMNKIYELSRFPEENWNPVMKICTDGTLTYVNPRCGPILKAWSTKLDQQVPDNIKEVIIDVTKRRQAQSVEIETPDGDYFSIIFAPLMLDDTHVHGYGRDITAQKRYEQELIEHQNNLEATVAARTEELEEARDQADQANKAKSMFLANMSHEIRTPLTAIIGYAEMLRDATVSEQEKATALQTIINSGNHLKGVINDILDISKIEAEKLNIETLRVDVSRILAEVTSLIDAQARDKKLKFTISYQYPVPTTIMSDSVRIKQILLNLCSNALKFTHEGSINIEVACDRENEQLSFCVSDTGIGMSQSQQEHIFSAFVQADESTTRKYGGTGLGLTLSKQLCQMLGGDLIVNSEPDVGSQFTATMSTGALNDDVMTNEMLHVESIVNSISRNQNIFFKGKVLLAEDTPEIRQYAVLRLQQLGLEVETVSNGALAMNSALSNDYDLVLMDMQMPIMDGYTAAEKLREKGYTVPIIAMTANIMPADQKKCFEHGCTDFVAKPIEQNKLIEVLNKYLPTTDRSETVLRSTLDEDDQDILELMDQFLESLAKHVENCLQAFADHNFADLAEILHQLKGMCGNFGFQIISDKAADLELAIKANETSIVAQLLDDLSTLNARAQKSSAS